MSVRLAHAAAITSSEGRQPPGKTYVRMKLFAGLLDLVGAVVHRDRLQQHRAVGREQVAAALEERAEVLPADRLDHLERDELVVGAAQVAVVVEAEVDQVLDAGCAHASSGDVVLLARDRGGRDAAAARGRGVDGEAAPAGADLEHVVARAELELLADQLELGERRLLERRVAVREDPHEYIIVGSSISSNSSLPRS